MESKQQGKREGQRYRECLVMLAHHFVGVAAPEYRGYFHKHTGQTKIMAQAINSFGNAHVSTHGPHVCLQHQFLP